MARLLFLLLFVVTQCALAANTRRRLPKGTALVKEEVIYEDSKSFIAKEDIQSPVLETRSSLSYEYSLSLSYEYSTLPPYEYSLSLSYEYSTLTPYEYSMSLSHKVRKSPSDKDSKSPSHKVSKSLFYEDNASLSYEYSMSFPYEEPLCKCECCPGTGNGTGTGKRNITALELSFVMLPPNASNPALALPSAIDPIGTTWIYNSGLLTVNASSLLGASVIGYCIRLQGPVGITAVDAVSGKGYCHLSYTIVDEASNQVTFNAAGEVIDLTGGTLAISGGTGALQGVDGELVLVPSFVNTTTEFNFFTQAAFYLGVATLFIQGY